MDGGEKTKDRSCYFEAELIHTLLVSDFMEHDIWFLNNQAKSYFEQGSDDISPNYSQKIEYIKPLLSLVPDALISTLIWKGP